MFTGFTDETVDFLWGIRFNNERTWFEAHKEQYLTHLYNPMVALAEELLDFARKKRPDYPLNRKVTRIYRDARRLFGRGPYKDHLWLTVEEPAEEWTARPALWFEIEPEGWSYGLSYWMPRPAAMAKLRARIDREPEAMEALTRKLRRSKEFTLHTTEYKRPRSAPPSEILAPWYRAKGFSIGHEDRLTEELFSRAVVERMEKGISFLLPYYDYFRTVESEPEPTDTRRRSGQNDRSEGI